MMLGVREPRRAGSLSLACHSSFPSTFPEWLYVSMCTQNKEKPNNILLPPGCCWQAKREIVNFLGQVLLYLSWGSTKGHASRWLSQWWGTSTPSSEHFILACARGRKTCRTGMSPSIPAAWEQPQNSKWQLRHPAWWRRPSPPTSAMVTPAHPKGHSCSLGYWRDGCDTAAKYPGTPCFLQADTWLFFHTS